MSLDPDAQAIADMLAAQMPGSLSELGVEGGRAFFEALSEQAPPGASLHAVTERLIPGPAGDIKVRTYRPSAQEDLPALLYFHGGGWVMGSLDFVDPVCRELANRAQCAVVSVDYRLAPEAPFPAAVDDGYSALLWVAVHGADIGVDPSRIAVGGDSAGANIAAAVSLVARDDNGPSIALQLLAYPATEYCVARQSWVEHANAPLLTSDDVRWFWRQYLVDVERFCDDPRATPMNAPSLEQLPPALVLTAEYDPMRDDGEAYAARLASEGVDVTAERYSGVFHGFFTMVGMLGQTEAAIGDAAEHLKKAFAQRASRTV
ncbi:alpha/beta hydrolase [Mycobacterium vicinigordonae]|uniref:Alpha/beta hydrolase n=1 Tax=Mycobacterium vicinigordonae TaxID=1719132 RepID=A0A7D6HZK9_9MYCO|nr:alpha/beta hydrolase [Mycobacterium vicinigordonae]QLL06494.1 alpha/beta hydrolase [Mycobacterium vicinigordonae]